MLETIRLLATVSRAEFLLPNLGSLIMGLAWGFTPSIPLTDLALFVILSFAVINLSSVVGAQANTLFDYELDSKDNRKKKLVQAVDSIGRNRLKTLLIIEFLLTLVLVSVFMLILRNPTLLLMWIVGISLGCAYSAPPLRLKSRSWLALVSLILVLAVFPVLFAYYTFASEMQLLFLLSLSGLALTIYGVIIPTEIRDYFGDKAMDIETMTVHLGLVKASFLSMFLLAIGSILISTAFFLELAYGPHPFLSAFLVVIPIAVFVVMRKFKKLYGLSKEYVSLHSRGISGEELVNLAAHNPQWIMLITQTYSLMSVMLLLSKSLL